MDRTIIHRTEARYVGLDPLLHQGYHGGELVGAYVIEVWVQEYAETGELTTRVSGRRYSVLRDGTLGKRRGDIYFDLHRAEDDRTPPEWLTALIEDAKQAHLDHRKEA